jgi:pimeloyl-ACP methyl ester carboxylesterase
MHDILDDVANCPAYYQLLIKSVLLPGLMELTETRVPTHLVVCEKDRVLPHPRYTRTFTEHIPDITQVTEFDDVGHIPMFEAPERVTDVILDFVDKYASWPRVQSTG